MQHPQNPQSQTLQGNVTKSMADNNPPILLLLCVAHRCYSAFQFVLCSGSTLGCLRACQFLLHFLVLDTAGPYYL